MNRRQFHRLGLFAAAAQFYGARLFAEQAAKATAPTISLMLWTLGKQFSSLEQVEIADRAGFKAVQLLTEYRKWTPEQSQAFKAKMKSSGIVVDSMLPGTNSLANPEQMESNLAMVKSAIPYAKELGCKQFIMTPNARVAGQTDDVKRQTIAEFLTKASDATAADGIECLLEPIDNLENKTSSVTSVLEGFQIVRSVNRPNIKVLYDFYHEQRQHGNLLEKLDGNLDLIGLVHVADVPGRKEPGSGEMDYKSIYKRLAALNYKRNIAMEFYTSGSDQVATLRKARLDAVAAFEGQVL